MKEEREIKRELDKNRRIAIVSMFTYGVNTLIYTRELLSDYGLKDLSREEILFKFLK